SFATDDSFALGVPFVIFDVEDGFVRGVDDASFHDFFGCGDAASALDTSAFFFGGSGDAGSIFVFLGTGEAGSILDFFGIGDAASVGGLAVFFGKGGGISVFVFFAGGMQ